MMKKTLILTGDAAKNAAIEYVKNAPEGSVFYVGPKTRTLDQNAALWPLLESVSRQIEWYGTKLTADEWKAIFSAVLKKQKTVPGIEGGFVVCSQSTSVMNKQEFSDLLDVIHAFAASKGIEL